METLTGTEIVYLLRNWVASLPQNTVETKEKQFNNQDDLEIKIIPRKENCCEITFTVSDIGMSVLEFGVGFAFQDLRLTKSQILDICESIRKGHLSEFVWEWHGKVLHTEGQLNLNEGHLRDKGYKSLLGFIGFGNRKEMKYEPWD